MTRPSGPVTQPKHWHLEKSVSITQIVSILTVAAACIWQFASMDKRIDINSNEISHNSLKIQDVIAEQNQLKNNIRQDLRDINSKLDRIIENSARH